MGFMSRKIVPACETMCVCCPALRSRSRQPVKRYKKLLSEIFSKSLNGATNARKIVKLCEYAAKNPFRIPKIAKYLEDKCYKELQSEQIKFINVVTEAYNKMLIVCHKQMAYFAANLLNVITELLDYTKLDETRILGCQILMRFIYSQKDGTYTHNIENFVHKVCNLAHEEGSEHQKRCLRASGLQCISAMVWFMGEFDYIFADIDEVVRVTLNNYEPDLGCENNENTEQTTNHNWVDEVIRCESRGTYMSIGNKFVRPPTLRKDPSLLTKEENETPKVWAQICVQRMAEVAKESSTLRCLLDPMFNYFDLRRQWVLPNGSAFILLSDMIYMMENSGNQESILSAVVRHMENKHVAHNPELKSGVVLVAACLVRQIRTGSVLREIGFVNDLCRHLRKSIQATAETVGEQELTANITLQSSIEDLLLEIAIGIGDTEPLFDMMALALERLPSNGAVSQAAIGSLLILAHVISSVSSASQTQKVFCETLLFQLLKAMLHPNVETRVGAHQIFSVLLMPSHNRPHSALASVRSGSLYRPKTLHPDTKPASAVTALFEKLRSDKDGAKIERDGCNNIHEELKNFKTFPNFYSLSSILDKTAGSTNLVEMEPFILKFSEDQVVQLLSAFWIQATLPDNLPSNIEAIAHSFSAVLLSLRLKTPHESLIVSVFQLLLSLRNISLDLNHGTLPPVCQKLVFVLSTGMLMFGARRYHVPQLYDLLKASMPDDVDPYLGISNEFRVYLKPQANMKEFGTLADSQMATSVLLELRNKVQESENLILDILVKNLATTTKMEAEDVKQQLHEPFMADYSVICGSQTILALDHNPTYSKESLSSEEDGAATGTTVEEGITSQPSVAETLSLFPEMQPSPSDPQIISIGQLMESALEVAGQVAASAVSTSPLAYNTMANHCETFGTGTRNKLSDWLANENQTSHAVSRVLMTDKSIEEKKIDVMGAINVMGHHNQGLTMRLPPASPFDNFLKAAGC